MKMYDGGRGEVYILRGLPGSGKSTLAKSLHGVVFSTDQYFTKHDQYNFNFSLLPIAHQWTTIRIRGAIKNKIPRVIFDNTNAKAWDMKEVTQLSLKHQYSLFIIEPETPYKWDVLTLAEKTLHAVPAPMIQELKDRWEHDVSVDNILQSEFPY